MSSTKKVSKFVAENFSLGVKRWSDKTWNGTAPEGCWFYSTNTSAGSSSLEGANGSRVIRIKAETNEPKPDTILLQVPGGKQGGASLPESVYFGHHESNAGVVMSVEEFEKAKGLVQKGFAPLDSSVQQQVGA